MSYYRPTSFNNADVWKFLRGGTNLLTDTGLTISGWPAGCQVIGIAYEWAPFAGAAIKATADGDELTASGSFAVEDLTEGPAQFAPAGSVIRAYFQPFRGGFPGTPPGYGYLQPWPN